MTNSEEVITVLKELLESEELSKIEKVAFRQKIWELEAGCQLSFINQAHFLNNEKGGN